MTAPNRAGRQLSVGTLVLPLLFAGLALVALLLVPTPAAAHPFGEPQTARLSADGSNVVMRWSSPADDLLLLGGAVGAIPGRRTYVFDMSPDAEPEPVGRSDAELITSSPEVAAYLADHLAVRQDGDECEPDISLDGLADDGALIVFQCAHPVTEVEIEITMLTDVHEAYRTAALGDGTTTPDRTLYTIDEPAQAWSFATSDQRRDAIHLRTWAAIAGSLAALLGLSAWLWRRVKAGTT